MSAAVLGKLALWQKGGQLVRNYDKFVNDKGGNQKSLSLQLPAI